MTLAASWCFANGYILFYGDAESHLNISRALVDSKTPGYDQLGTVWLPVLHVICLPFVKHDWLWSTGLAGTIPVALCFVVAGVCIYLCARDVYGSASAAAVVLACFSLNPNVLYLATIPMTEIVFLAALFVAMWAVLRFRARQQWRWVAVVAAASCLLSLTRYDGWFLIPFLGLWLALVAVNHRLIVLASFAAIALVAPLYWMGHNWWETGHALDFFNGPYSAIAIQRHESYPGYHDWLAAAHYYGTAGYLCAGSALILLGCVGAFFVNRPAARETVVFLLLTPLFYLWSMHSSGGTPIHVPSLWPFSYYNTRYGIALVPLFAFAAGALVPALPERLRKFCWAIPLFAILPWCIHPSRQNWICWKESQVNSEDRRAWTRAAARVLNTSYRRGQGILTSTGDVTGIYRETGIHLSETLNIGNGPRWFLAITRPDLFHPNAWVIRQAGDGLARAIGPAAPYRQVRSIATSKYSPDLEILERHLP